MKKFMLKTYIWVCYILSIPFVVIFMTGLLIWDIATTVKEFGASGIDDIWDMVKDGYKAMIEGFKLGHMGNMWTIDYICEKKEN